MKEYLFELLKFAIGCFIDMSFVLQNLSVGYGVGSEPDFKLGSEYTSSQGGITAFQGQAAYISCKHGVIGMTPTAAMDYAAKNIRINAVCPGAILTPMADELIRRNPQVEKDLIRDIPAGRLGKPEEIADAVVWLCSPAASFVHGHALLVDGGFTIH